MLGVHVVGALVDALVEGGSVDGLLSAVVRQIEFRGMMP